MQSNHSVVIELFLSVSNTEMFPLEKSNYDEANLKGISFSWLL